MSFVHATRRNSKKNAKINGRFGSVYKENSVWEIKNNRFRKVFRPLENEKPAFSNFSGLVKVLLSSRISVDVRPNRRNKSTFSSSSRAL